MSKNKRPDGPRPEGSDGPGRPNNVGGHGLPSPGPCVPHALTFVTRRPGEARPAYDRLWVLDSQLVVRLNEAAADGWRVLSVHPARRAAPGGEAAGWDVILVR